MNEAKTYKKIELNKKYIATIVDLASTFQEIDKIVVFGSWALGNAKSGSDIDLALFGENITQLHLLQLKSILEEKTTIPNFFDIVHLESITNSELKNHILQHGVQIYPTATLSE